MLRIDAVKITGPMYRIPDRITLLSWKYNQSKEYYLKSKNKIKQKVLSCEKLHGITHPFSANWAWKDDAEYPAITDERAYSTTRQFSSPPRL